MAFKLTWLPDVLLDAGLRVAEQPGWRTRGRGDVRTIKGVICHHTAGPLRGNMPSLRVVTNGRSNLRGPLSQLCLGRDGTYYVVAAGLSQHAGRGNWQGIRTGNSSFIGIEAENTGLENDFPWPDVQMDAYRRGVAAILNKIRADAIMCAGHKEWAPRRKPDPLFDMNVFRLQVRSIMNGGGPVRDPIPAEDPDSRATLRRGDFGDLVEEIQTKLRLVPDGFFGPITEAKVREFQTSHGIVPDGIVGPQTWAALDGG